MRKLILAAAFAALALAAHGQEPKHAIWGQNYRFVTIAPAGNIVYDPKEWFTKEECDNERFLWTRNFVTGAPSGRMAACIPANELNDAEYLRDTVR